MKATVHTSIVTIKLRQSFRVHSYNDVVSCWWLYPPIAVSAMPRGCLDSERSPCFVIDIYKHLLSRVAVPCMRACMAYRSREHPEAMSARTIGAWTMKHGAYGKGLLCMYLQCNLLHLLQSKMMPGPFEKWTNGYRWSILRVSTRVLNA